MNQLPTYTIHYQIAKICHQANKAYCEANDDFSQVDWADAPEWQQKSAVNGVKYAELNPHAAPGTMHQMWVDEKVFSGWVYGEVKDADAKTHPCLVSFDKLPKEAQLKDHLFLAICKALL